MTTENSSIDLLGLEDTFDEDDHNIGLTVGGFVDNNYSDLPVSFTTHLNYFRNGEHGNDASLGRHEFMNPIYD